MKRLYCLILTLILTFSLLPSWATAEGTAYGATDCEPFFQEGAYEGPQDLPRSGATLFFAGDDLETRILTRMAEVHAGTVAPEYIENRVDGATEH